MTDLYKFDAAVVDNFSAQALQKGDLAQAHVLVGLCHGDMSLEHWQRLVAAGERPGPQVWQAMRDRRGYIHGLFAHRTEHDLIDGATLSLTDILTAGHSWRAMLEAVEAAARAIARDEGCPTIRMLLHPDRQAPSPEQLRTVFCALGYCDCGPYLKRAAPLAIA